MTAPSSAPVRVKVVHHFASPPEDVYDKLIQHESYEKFGLTVLQVRDSAAGPHGVGSARNVKVGPLPAFWESTTSAERPTLIEYTIIEGSPLRNHWGRQELTPTPDGGTRLTYTIRFDSAIPGTTAILARLLTMAVARGLPRLCR